MAKRQLSESAKVAKIIKAELKKHGIECRAKSNNYSMGSSVDIYIEDQPPWVVEAIKKQTDKYEYGTFDGMTDCQGVKNRGLDVPQVKYLTIHNSFSEDSERKAWEKLVNHFSGFEGATFEKRGSFFNEGAHEYGSTMLWRYLTGYYSDFQYFEKPIKKLTSKPAVNVSVNAGQYEIKEITHTKRQVNIFIASPVSKLERADFLSEKDRASSLGGYYSRKFGDSPAGFAFESLSIAEQFAGASGNAEPPKPSKTNKEKVY